MNSRTDQDRVPVFDASAVLALLQGEPGSDRLRALQPRAVVSSVNVAEVLAKLASKGMPLCEAKAAFGALHLVVEPFDSAMAFASADHVGKNVSLGDRCFLATARALHGAAWTSDRDLKAAAGDYAASIRFLR